MEARVLEHDRVGSGEPPFVLLPGGLTGWRSWLPLVPSLSAARGVVRLQPIANAEGLAGRTGDAGYGAEVERESIAATLDLLGIERMHLVGWSNGGRMALDFSLAFPERVRSLTMIEPAAWWLVGEEASARSFAEFLADCAGRECDEDDVLRFLVGAGVGGPETDFSAMPQWDFWVSCANVISWYGDGAVRSAEAGIEGFERLGTPTLLVRGRTTAPWLRAVVDVLADRLPDTRTVDLDGGHACLLESAEDFTGALLSHAEASDG